MNWPWKMSSRLGQQRYSDTPATTSPQVRHVSRRMSEPVAIGSSQLGKLKSSRQLNLNHINNNSKAVGPIQLSDAQRLLLRVSWSHAIKRSGKGNIGASVLTKMFQDVPATKDCLGLAKTPTSCCQYQTSFVQHSNAITALLNQILTSLDSDDQTDLIDTLRDMGKAHANGKGFRPAFWDDFAVAVTESAIQWEGPGKKGETIRAWRLLMSQITEELRLGYETEMRLMRRRSGSLPTSGH